MTATRGKHVIPHTRKVTRLGNDILVWQNTPEAKLEQLRRQHPSAAAEIERLRSIPVPASFHVDPGKSPATTETKGQLRLV